MSFWADLLYSLLEKPYHSWKERNHMKIIIGLILILIGAAVGIYLGFWVMFIGGIVQIINACQNHPVLASGIAVGALRILFATIIGFASFFLFLATGAGFIHSGLKK
jgi:hypothetical protein